MAGSIPGSDLAERTAGLSSSASAPAHAKRWRRLRRLARARLAPFGAAVMLLAVLAALAAPLLAPHDPLAQNLGTPWPGRAGPSPGHGQRGARRALESDLGRACFPGGRPRLGLARSGRGQPARHPGR